MDKQEQPATSTRSSTDCYQFPHAVSADGPPPATRGVFYWCWRVGNKSRFHGWMLMRFNGDYFTTFNGSTVGKTEVTHWIELPTPETLN